MAKMRHDPVRVTLNDQNAFGSHRYWLQSIPCRNSTVGSYGAVHLFNADMCQLYAFGSAMYLIYRKLGQQTLHDSQ